MSRPALETKRQSAGSRSRYLFFCFWPVRPGTGVNNVILGLANAMRGQYEPAIVVTGFRKPSPPDGQQWLKLRLPVLSLASLAKFLLSLGPTLLRLRQAVRGAVAINPHYIGPEFLPLVLLRKIGLAPALILSVHGADVTYAARARGLERKLLAWLYQNADRVIACSGALASEVNGISPKAKVSVVWNGISPPNETLPSTRPLESPYLVSVAAFVKKKAHDDLLQAFKLISSDYPDLILVLIGGDGPERNAITELIERLDLQSKVRILLDLHHDEVWPWLRHAECFVHAAREEPFGIAVLEAGLTSTPIVTTAVGGIPEYLTHRVHGLTCEPHNPGQLAAAVIETLKDPLTARQRAQTFHDWATSFTWVSAWNKYAAILGFDQSQPSRQSDKESRVDTRVRQEIASKITEELSNPSE